MNALAHLSDIIIPILIFFIVGYGFVSKVKVYESFLKGAKDGLKIVVDIVPTLIGLLVAVGMLRASGFFEMLGTVLGPAAAAVGLPAQLMPLLVVKLFSSSAATGLVLDIFRTSGPDSYAGMLTSILMSCTETVFYTMSVYFLAAKVTKTRFTLTGALLATLAGTVMSVVLAGVIGTAFGLLAGYYGGVLDAVVMRITDAFHSIPRMLLAMVAVSLMKAGIGTLVLVIGVTGWITYARLIRSEVLVLKEREFVKAAITIGTPDYIIIFRHILPNAVGTIITGCALSVPSVVFQEAGLAYLGLGVQAPNPSIGILLSDGQKVLLDYPSQLVFPGIVIVLLMLAFNLLGNGLRDAFNPSLRQ